MRINIYSKSVGPQKRNKLQSREFDQPQASIEENFLTRNHCFVDLRMVALVVLKKNTFSFQEISILNMLKQ
jgi:hypothetical protein